MNGSVFRRCTAKDCRARLEPRDRRCPGCEGRAYSWGFLADVGLDAAGKRRQRRRAGFDSKEDAERALRKILGDVDRRAYVDPSRLPLADYLGRWLAGIRVKPTTLDGYRQSAEVHVIPRLGDVGLQALTAEHLDELYRELERSGQRAGQCRTAGVTCAEHGCAPANHKGLAPKSVRNVHTMLRKALQDAVERGHVGRNVADLANPPTQRQARSRRAKLRVWTGEQLRAFVEAVRTDRLYAAWYLFSTTGMRKAELLGLRVSDVELDAARLKVGEQTLTQVRGRLVWSSEAEPGKTEAAERTLALDAGTVAVLREWLARRAEHRLAAGAAWRGESHLDEQGLERGPLLFTDELGQPIKPDALYRRFVLLGDRAGLPRLDVHGLRHSYATAALLAGVPTKVLSERLGHASTAITEDLYMHVLEGMDAAAAEAVATAIHGPAARPAVEVVTPL